MYGSVLGTVMVQGVGSGLPQELYNLVKVRDMDTINNNSREMCSNGSALEQCVNTFFLEELVKRDSIDELVVVLNNRKVSHFQQSCKSKERF